MLKSIKYLNTIEGHRAFLLEDTGFNCETSITNFYPDASHYSNNIVREALLILEYKKRNLPIAKNIALLYSSYTSISTSLARVSGWLEPDKDEIDTQFPELEYGKKYYRCVCNQVKRLISASSLKR